MPVEKTPSPTRREKLVLARKDVAVDVAPRPVPATPSREAARPGRGRTRRLAAVGIVAGALTVLILAIGQPPAEAPNTVGNEPWRSAVQVAWATSADDELSFCDGGSGGLIGAVDRVLTNQHVIDGPGESEGCKEATLYVGYPVEETGTYFAWWPATVTASDEFIDLALVSVLLSGKPLLDDPEYSAPEIQQGSWPSFSLAAATPKIGDPISVYSYPGIGGYSLTFTSGFVAGWSWEYWSKEDAADQSDAWIASYKKDKDGIVDYMKLDVTVAHGSSGSSVLNEHGEIVGVATLVGVNLSGETVDCQQLADTNGDGATDDRDTCIPVGGFLNAAITLDEIRAFLAANGAAE